MESEQKAKLNSKPKLVSAWIMVPDPMNPGWTKPELIWSK